MGLSQESTISPGLSPPASASYREVRFNVRRGERVRGVRGAAHAAGLGVKVSWLDAQVRLGRVPSDKIGPFRRFTRRERETGARNHE